MAMDVRLGAAVIGTDGKLGEVNRFMLDEPRDIVTDIVVKHGFLFAGERVVPFTHITRIDAHGVHLDLDKRAFEAMEGFSDQRYLARDPDYEGPPGHDRGPEFLVEEAVDQGAQMGLGGMAKPFGFPGGETLVPHERQRPVLSRGLPVLDVHGTKIGEVHDCAVSPETKRPTLLTIRGGVDVLHAHPVEVGLIQDISADGVVLSVGKEQLRT